MEDTTTVETTTDTAPEAGTETVVETTTKPAEDPRVSKANREAAEYRKRLRAAEAELEKVRQSSLTEAERAIAEAKSSARAEARAEIGQERVRDKFEALAAGRIPNLAELLDDLNLAKFLTEDGTPDTAAIDKAITRLAPAQSDNTRQPGPRPDLSQGGSNKNVALNSDELTEALRAAVGG
jgi:hypothetical protein